MVISRDVDYALRILRCLADGKLHGIGSICEEERIPRQQANRIITKLQEHMLVECVKGRGGGCKLSCNLEKITIFEIMQIVDSSCQFNICLAPEHVCPWRRSHVDSRHVHPKLAELQADINDRLKRLKVHTLILDEKNG